MPGPGPFAAQVQAPVPVTVPVPTTVATTSPRAARQPSERMQALQRTFSTKSEPAAAAASVPGSSVSPRSNTSVKPSVTSTSTVQAVNAAKPSVGTAQSAPSGSKQAAGDSAEADELVRIPVATAATPVTASATSPTILVALHGNNVDLEAVAKELEQRPERLNERDGNGRTPLLAACFAKKWDVAKYFIARGADVSAKDKVF
jgi:hypothetical protein